MRTTASPVLRWCGPMICKRRPKTRPGRTAPPIGISRRTHAGELADAL